MESQNPAISNTHLLMDDDMNEPSSLSAESTSMGMRDSVVDALPPNNTDGDVSLCLTPCCSNVFVIVVCFSLN